MTSQCEKPHGTCPASILWIAGVVEHVENCLFLTCCFGKQCFLLNPPSILCAPIQSLKIVNKEQLLEQNVQQHNKSWRIMEHHLLLYKFWADNLSLETSKRRMKHRALGLESYSFRSPQHTFQGLPVSPVFITILTFFLTLGSPKQKHKTNSSTTPVWHYIFQMPAVGFGVMGTSAASGRNKYCPALFQALLGVIF